MAKKNTKHIQDEESVLETDTKPYYVDFGDVIFPFDVVLGPNYDFRKLANYHFIISGIFYKYGEVFHAVRVNSKLSNNKNT